MQAKTAVAKKVMLKDQRFNRYKYPSRRDIVEYIKSYYICYTPIYIKVPVAFWKFGVEKFYGLMIILFYQGLKKKIKQHISLWMVEEMPYFFLANTCIKLTLLVWYYHRYICMCMYIMCVYIHICDEYIHTKHWLWSRIM